MGKNRAVPGQLKVMETANPKLYAVEIMALAEMERLLHRKRKTGVHCC